MKNKYLTKGNHEDSGNYMKAIQSTNLPIRVLYQRIIHLHYQHIQIGNIESFDKECGNIIDN